MRGNPLGSIVQTGYYKGIFSLALSGKVTCLQTLLPLNSVLGQFCQIVLGNSCFTCVWKRRVMLLHNS